MRTVLGNFIGLQVCWFCCVLGGANGWPWLGPAAVAAACALWLFGSRRPRREALYLVAAGALGVALDSALVLGGVLRFPEVPLRLALSPVWMAALWVIFATAVPISLSWMRGRYLLAAAIGAAAGPLSYLGGARLGGVLLGPTLETALLAVAVEWAVAMPALVALETALLAQTPSPVETKV